jgi:hypothetical protein
MLRQLVLLLFMIEQREAAEGYCTASTPIDPLIIAETLIVPIQATQTITTFNPNVGAHCTDCGQLFFEFNYTSGLTTTLSFVANGVVTDGETTGEFPNGLRFLDSVWAHDG